MKNKCAVSVGKQGHQTRCQGWEMEKLRAEHLEGKFNKTCICIDCPDWAYTNWPDEGKSYANAMKEVGEKE